MDRNYQKLKITMLSELKNIDPCIIYSCYIKKDSSFTQKLKENTYISLLYKIAKTVSDDIDIVFDTFNKQDFEYNIIEELSSLSNVTSIRSCDSQKNPGLQFVDNLCSVYRLYLDGNDKHNFFDIIKEKV